MDKMPELSPGTRVRAKVRTIMGWKGYGVVISDDGDILKDGGGIATFCDYELAICRDQTGDKNVQRIRRVLQQGTGEEIAALRQLR
jgi:hypothetical protein